MRPLPFRRAANSLAVVAGLAGLAGLTACSDAPLAAPPAPPVADRGGAATVYVPYTLSADGDTVSATFTVHPSAAESYVFPGGHRIHIAAASVCDPALTAYGPLHWDKPCTPIARPLTFRIKSWVNAAGRTRLRITPDVRFVPGKVNTLWLNDPSAAWGHGFIAWCPTGSPGCVDEAQSDPTAHTTTDPTTGMLRRRLKHFSGYTVIAD